MGLKAADGAGSWFEKALYSLADQWGKFFLTRLLIVFVLSSLEVLKVVIRLWLQTTWTSAQRYFQSTGTVMLACIPNFAVLHVLSTTSQMVLLAVKHQSTWTFASPLVVTSHGGHGYICQKTTATTAPALHLSQSRLSNFCQVQHAAQQGCGC